VPRRTGSVITRIPSISISTVACPTQVIARWPGFAPACSEREASGVTASPQPSCPGLSSSDRDEDGPESLLPDRARELNSGARLSARGKHAPL
jgi:hypothetical protein